ncbi:hypothetical protein [Psychrobacter sp. DAB_AL43B]|uniref:hypothetical protein n=1 Tax=Psychrobacter sp. DAB_AL43B TaxID=1028416 RepID=UPI0009A6720A|nr:hypothetical protein [Psychrobacter sp. DAB_AL43B]
MNGVTLEEEKLGFETSNFSNDSFQVKIENNVAFINFSANDLARDLESPQQVIDFTHAISMTSEQFDTVNRTEICVNNTYNYQMIFFANVDSVDCPFSF